MFDAFWGTFQSYQGTLGATLTTQVMGDVFSARSRRFDNSLQQALFEDNMPERVYRTLVAQANAGLPTLHRYLRLRKQLLGIQDELAYYDNYPSLFKVAEPPRFTLEESQKITLAALAPMGDEYLALLEARLRLALDRSVSAHRQGRRRLRGRFGLRRASVRAAQPQRRLRVADHRGARVGPRGALAARQREPAVREGRLFDLHCRIRVDRQRDAAGRLPGAQARAAASRSSSTSASSSS